MKNSLIGQLASFALAIIGGILGVINSIRKEMQRRAEALLRGTEISAEELEKRAQLKKLQEMEVFRETIQFFATNSAHIEVVRDEKIETIYFYKLPFCQYLPDETKTEFNDSVCRDSANDKVSGLVE
jgi:hypothetical protein